MLVTRKENKLKQEITLSICNVFNKDNVKFLYDEIKNCVIDEMWERIIIDFNDTKEIDIEAIKALWELKDISNSKQKPLDFINLNGRVAIAFKFLGFEEKCNINIDVDKKSINSVTMLGEYEEPLYENKVSINEICDRDEILSLESMSNFVNELNEIFGFDIKEWTMISDFNKNKLIFLLEAKNISDVEKAEEYLSNLTLSNYNMKTSIYILEDGTFKEYRNRKLKLGVPEALIIIPKFIKNPYTKQYFLSKIDERY